MKKTKFLLATLLALIGISSAWADRSVNQLQYGKQTIEVASDETITFYDPWGTENIVESSTYNSQSLTVFKPAEAGKAIQITFEEFDLNQWSASYFLYINIYDGIADAGNTFSFPIHYNQISSSSNLNAMTGDLIGEKLQNNNKPNNEYVSTSADGALSVAFMHRNSNTCKGWVAKVKSVAPDTRYKVDFNKTITTNYSGFAVASNWSHVVDVNPDYDNNMSYSYAATAGVEGSGALLAYRQLQYNNMQEMSGVTSYDLLVTPAVSGKVTLDVKKYNDNGAIKFYKVTGTPGAFVRGDEIVATGADALSTSEFTTVEMTVDPETRIGIWANYAYIDNFTAETVTLLPESKITIASADPSATTGTIYWDQQPNGKVLVKYTVTVKNTGEVDLAVGDMNYSVSIINGKTNEIIATTNVPQNLAVGATSAAFDVEAEVDPAGIWPNSYTYVSMNLQENLTATTLSRAQSSYHAYESKFVFRQAGNTGTSSLSATQAYGVSTQTVSKQYEIYNDGIAPLTLKSITLPEGFTSADLPAENTVVDKKQKVQFTVTLPGDVTGNFSDDLTVVYLNEKDEENTYTLAFSGTMVPEGTFVADFSSTTSGSVTFPEGAIKEGGVREGTTYITSGNYDGYLYSYTSTGYANANNKFITPLLHATSGEQLTFDVARDGSNSGSMYNLKVYVSTDRQNWGEPVFSVTAADLTSEFQNKSITINRPGDYYVAFAIFGVKLDNVVGLKKVDVAHDLFVKSASWDEVCNSGATLKPSVEIIPLTTEAAANYTVKFYLDDQAVATATSKALTASVSATQTFSFNYTPEVEKTTTYDSYVRFEFTDGTTIDSEHRQLKVTYEPEFHFYTSLPTSKWYKPTDYTADIVFTKTNQPGEKKSFYIYNYGAASMQVKSISLPIGFTTTLEAPFTVAPYDDSSTAALANSAQQFEITFAPEFAAEFSGNMHIVYVDGEGKDQTFTLPVSGILLDANKFYANFDGDPVWPAGSVYQSNVSSSNGGTYSAPNYYISSTNATNNLFITPKLHAVSGDYLKFDAKLYSSSWSEGTVQVYAAETREALINGEGTLLATVSGEATDEALKMGTDYKTFTLNFPQRGDCFIGFAISGRAQLDEIYGLQNVAVAADLMLDEPVIPSEAMQNVNASATLKIRNVGLQTLAAADYKVIAYIDGEATEVEGTVDLPIINKLTESTAVNVAFRSHKLGTFPVYFEVVAGDFVAQTEPVDVTFTEEKQNGELAGDPNGVSASTPLNLNYYNSESVSLYTANVLQDMYGLKNGDKIKSITYKGYKTSANHVSTLNLWYEWTDDQTLEQPANGKMDVPATMTQYYTNEEYTWEMKGSASELADFITLTFDEPLVYEAGKSLRVVMYSKSTAYKYTNFEYGTSATAGLNYYHYNDTESTFNTNSWTSACLPVIHIALEVEPATFSGVVTDGTDPIEGATVTLVSNDGDNIQYTATTDAEGQYTINVIQTAREYTALAYLEKYVDATTTVNFAEGSQTHDFVLASITDLESLKDYANLFKGEKMNKDVRAALVAAAAVEPVAGDPEATLKATKDLKEACDAAVMSLLAYYRVAMIPDVVNNTNVYTSEAYIAYAEAFKPIQAAYKAETLTTEEAEAIGEEWFTNDSPLGQLLLSPWDEESPITMNKYGNLIATGTVTARLNYINEGVYDITALYEAVGEGITFQAVGGEEVELETENIQELMAKAVLAPKGEFTLTFNVPEGSLITFTDLWFELNRAETAEQEKADELDAAKAEWAAAVADLQTALGEAQTLREQSETSKVEEESVNELDAAIAAAELLLGEEVELVTTSDYVNKTKELAAAAKRLRSATIKVKRSITVGISTVMADGLDLNAPMYNAQGKRVNRNYRGIIIQNGQKFNRK